MPVERRLILDDALGNGRHNDVAAVAGVSRDGKPPAAVSRLLSRRHRYCARAEESQCEFPDHAALQVLVATAYAHSSGSGAGLALPSDVGFAARIACQFSIAFHSRR